MLATREIRSPERVRLARSHQERSRTWVWVVAIYKRFRYTSEGIVVTIFPAGGARDLARGTPTRLPEIPVHVVEPFSLLDSSHVLIEV